VVAHERVLAGIDRVQQLADAVGHERVGGAHGELGVVVADQLVLEVIQGQHIAAVGKRERDAVAFVHVAPEDERAAVRIGHFEGRLTRPFVMSPSFTRRATRASRAPRRCSRLVERAAPLCSAR
jgi:hypothetical protein